MLRRPESLDLPTSARLAATEPASQPPAWAALGARAVRTRPKAVPAKSSIRAFRLSTASSRRPESSTART